MRARYANLINLILDRGVVPEFIQRRCRADYLTPAVSRLFGPEGARQREAVQPALMQLGRGARAPSARARSEEHTSELQPRRNVVCRLLLEKTNHPILPSYHQPRSFRLLPPA